VVWTRLIWFRIGTSRELLWTFGFHQMLGSSWVTGLLVPSQEGFSYTELVILLAQWFLRHRVSRRCCAMSWDGSRIKRLHITLRIYFLDRSFLWRDIMREQYEQSVPAQDSNLRPHKKSVDVRHSLYTSVTRRHVCWKYILLHCCSC
jgi:hypothetical protein